jgi:predicted transposase YbfD/YdcC
MIPETIPPIIDFFSDIKDPRIERKKCYPLIEVIVITLLAVMAFAKGWEDIELYGKTKEAWLKPFLPLKNGIPQHDVYRRVFNRLDPREIERCFMAWVRVIKQDKEREVIAIDGKTVRGSFNTRQESKAIHLVSAWATENRLVFAQVKTEEKSNEITAIPTLLEMIALKGCIVTIDAMGCQYKIANQIVSAGADYVLSLKENQETLYDDVKTYFEGIDFAHPTPLIKTSSTFEVDHGRQERRNHAVTDDVSWLVAAHPAWNTIKSIGVVESIRTVGEAVTTEQRYYISSLPADPVVFGTSVRAHWGIENSLHYVLDVAFGEDACRIKSGNAPENLTFIRKTALSLARSDTQSKRSIASRIKQMAWSNEYLEQLLFQSGLVDQTEVSASIP